MWVQASDQGFWQWTVYEPPIGQVMQHGTGYWRWTALWKARRWCKQHNNGTIKDPDTGARTVYYKP